MSKESLENSKELQDSNQDPFMPNEIIVWIKRLEQVGVQVINLAYSDLYPWGSRDFDNQDTTENEKLGQIWLNLKERLTEQQPVALNRENNNLIIAYLISVQGDQRSILGCQIALPYNEKTLQLFQLSLGWLQSAMYADAAQQGAQTTQLMEIMGYVLSQKNSHIAAQEWINRTMAWVRGVSGKDLGLSLSLFTIKKAVPKWWVSSDMAWAEKGAATMQHAIEIATRAVIESQEQLQLGWWAFPLFEQGEPTAVLLAYQPATQAIEIPKFSLEIMRSSSLFAEPILRNWQKSESNLLVHFRKSFTESWHKLTGYGHYTWKLIATTLLLIFAIITLWPVNDLVNADLSVEGKTRWIVSSPSQGFLASVSVRPGDRVIKNQVLAHLDDRDLRVEQSQYQSEVEQAAARFRTAMAENDAAASGQAANELAQAEAKLLAVNHNLERMVLKAPITGIVSNGDWTQQIGAPIENGKQLFEISTQDAYRVVIQIADQDIDRVSVGQTGILRLTSLPDQNYNFRIERVTPVASVQAGKNSFRVEAVWLDSPPALHPGMQGVGKILVGKTNLIKRWTANFVDWARLKLWQFW